MGNVPGQWSEVQTIEYFVALGLPRATKIKLRCGGGVHREQYGVAYFATKEVTDKYLAASILFPSGRHCLVRCSPLPTSTIQTMPGLCSFDPSIAGKLSLWM